METYIVPAKVTGSARGMDFANPPDPEKELKGMVEAAGGKLLHTWATLGRFEAVVVVEVPDDRALRAVAAASPMQVSTESLRAFPGMAEAADPEYFALLKKVVEA
jgi:uncharacterized protein with GYD domain